jgi:acetyl-CoA C-acetyltransferase
MQDIVILSAVRTPIGAFQGAFKSVPVHVLGSRALEGAIERAGVQPEDIDQVYMGSVLTAGVGQAPARQATLGAGCPVSTGAVTVGKVCGEHEPGTLSGGRCA